MGRIILKNTAAYLLAGLTPYIVNFFMIPVYTRFMPPSQYGVLSLANAFGAFVACFMGLKLSSSVHRYSFDYDEKGVARFFSTMVFSTLAANFVIFGSLHLSGGLLARLLFPGAQISYKPYLILPMVAAFFSSLTGLSNTMLRARERGETVLILSLATALVGVGFGLYFVVYRGMGAHGVLLGTAFSSLVQMVISFIPVRKIVRLSFSTSMLRSGLTYALPVIPHALGGVLFMFADRFILGYYVPLASIGLYNIADRLAMLLRMAVESIGDAIQPSFIRYSQEGKEKTAASYRTVITKWTVLLSFACLGMAFFSEEVIMVLTPPAYHASHVFIPILLGAYFFRGLYGFPARAIMYEKKTALFPLITFSAGAFNVAANLLLIPRYGVMAAAWTTLASYALAFFLALSLSRRSYPLVWEWAKIGRVVALMVGLFLVTTGLGLEGFWLKVAAKLAALSLFAGVLLYWDYGDISRDLLEVRGWGSRLLRIGSR